MPLRTEDGAKKRWEGTTTRALQRVYSGAHPPSLFIAKVRALHHELRLAGPPFDPWHIATRLNIKINEESMALDGYLEKRPDGDFEIYLRKEAPVVRKRFTLCHEIAHTFFFDILADGRKFRQKHQDDPEEERLCDIAAAELLMPFASFNSDLIDAQGGSHLTPTGVLELTRRYQVSLQAVALRITWISRDTICALWNKKGPAVNLVWATPARTRSLVLCQTGRTSVEEAAATQGKDITARDSFYVVEQQTRLIRRLASSRRLPSGHVFSVLTPALTGSEGATTRTARPAQLSFSFT